MYCPTCGSEERQISQYCRACGTDLRMVRRGLETPDTITASAVSAREQISQRSEEHTSELQSLAYLVCRLLLEKKKKKKIHKYQLNNRLTNESGSAEDERLLKNGQDAD